MGYSSATGIHWESFYDEEVLETSSGFFDEEALETSGGFFISLVSSKKTSGLKKAIRQNNS